MLGLRIVFITVILTVFVMARDRSPSVNTFSAKPPQFDRVQHSVNPGSIWGKLRGPYPTNAYWGGVYLSNENNPAASLPYVVSASPIGLIVSSPNINFQKDTTFGTVTNDFYVGAKDFVAHNIIDYDHLSFTLQWKAINPLKGSTRSERKAKLENPDRWDSTLPSLDNCSASPLNPQPPSPSPKPSPPPPPPPAPPTPSSSPDFTKIEGGIKGIPENAMTVHIVYGSPFLTFKYSNAIPIFREYNGIVKVNNIADHGANFTAKRFIFDINNGNKFLIHVSSELTLRWSANVLVASASFTGIIRVASFKNDAQLAFLDGCVYPYAIAGGINTRFEGDKGYIDFIWITEGGDPSKLTMLALPHHADSLKTGNLLSSPTFTTLKGSMRPVVGSYWTLQENLTNIAWNSPNPIESKYMDEVISAVRRDSNYKTFVPADTYSFGKVSARYARLILIANITGESHARDSLLRVLEDILTPWCEGSNPDALLYDTTWGGIVSTSGIRNSGADYGQGWYNDHHFHYGYFLYSSAVLGSFNSVWMNKWKDRINLLARDIANPSSADNYFTTTRHKDWFAGHSWASGLFPFGDCKNQESTSEAVNGYYGLYLWGMAIGDNFMTNFGKLLTMTEIRSAKRYWHMDPSKPDIYKSPFVDNICVGILWGTKVDYATWFGKRVEYTHGIQMLPYTPITELLLDKEWITIEYPELQTSLTRSEPVIEEAWKGFVFMTQAIIDPDSAWNNSKILNSFDNGNSRSNTLWWIATRPRH